jgi:WD40 repeat protein
MVGISMSYRRANSAIAGRIADRLRLHFGTHSVFMDVHDIAAGLDFRQRIKEALANSLVLIAVIGPRWLNPPRRKGDHTTIQDANDWVRIEVETALENKRYIIPVLVEGGTMPKVAQLPPSLHEFAFRHAINLDSGADFDAHMSRLIDSIENVLQSRDILRAQPVVGEQVETTRVSAKRWTVFNRIAFLTYVDPRSRRVRFAVGMAAIVLAVLGVVGSGDWQEGSHRVAGQSPALSSQSTSSQPPESTPGPSSAPAKAPPQAAPPPASQLAARAPAALPARANPSSGSVQPGTSITAAIPSGQLASPLQPNSADTPSGCTAPNAASVGMGGALQRIAIKPVLSYAHKMRDLAISPDGTRIATAGDDGLVRLWDAASFTLQRVLKGHDNEVYSVAFWNDGSQLASTGLDGSIRTWSTATGAPLEVFRAHTGTRPIAQYGVAHSPSAPLRYVVSVGDEGIVWIWDVAQRMLDRTRPPKDAPTTIRSLSFSPTVPGEFVTAGYDGRVRLYRPGGRVDTTEPHLCSGKVLRVVFSPDGTRVASAGVDGQNLRIWDAKYPSQFKAYPGHTNSTTSVAWSSDGKRLISGGGWADKSVQVWNLENNSRLALLAGHESDVEGVAFLPKSARSVSISEDKTMKLWDIEHGRQLMTLVAFGDQEFAAYTPAGCYTGTPGVERMLHMSIDGVGRDLEITAEAKRKLFVSAAPARLIGGN